MNRKKGLVLAAIILISAVASFHALHAGATSLPGQEPASAPFQVMPGQQSSQPARNASSERVDPEPPAPSSPAVVARAGSGATIPFLERNGRLANGVRPEVQTLPHLVLYRNGMLTGAAERTLAVAVAGLELPPSGVTVTLAVKTQRGNPDLGPGHGDRLTVWHASQYVPNPGGVAQSNGTATFVHQFDAWLPTGTGRIATPTDYFSYELSVIDPAHPEDGPAQLIHQEYGFLMENQWLVPLPEVKEETDGAAPSELLLYYCDMVPFRRSQQDLDSWLPRERSAGYIEQELIPAMAEAFRLQSDAWGFPWHAAWSNPRFGEGAKQLSVALSDGQAWYHGPAPALGNALIAIRVTAAEFAHYDSLTDGIMSAFHHELFHSQQRNINQHQGGDDLVGPDGSWLFFTEGTAMLATAVAQPAVQFAQTSGPRAYLSRANEFLGAWTAEGDLHTSLVEASPYQAAIYWRFLYEQCGGMEEGREDPASGMRIIRQALQTLLSGPTMGEQWPADPAQLVTAVMDQALAGEAGCPFQTYQDSLNHFAGALALLDREDGRCSGPGLPAGCGLYDPNGLYASSPANR